jgi:hypothetical protein
LPPVAAVAFATGSTAATASVPITLAAVAAVVESRNVLRLQSAMSGTLSNIGQLFII